MSDTGTIVADNSVPVSAEAVPIEETAIEAAPEAEAAPETAPETEVAPAAPQTEEDKKFAAKFAALSRQQKEIRQQKKALEARIAEFEAKSKTPEAPKEVEAPLEYRLKKDPFGELKKLGLDYETLTRMALNDGKMTPELQMQLMREEIKAELDGKYGKELEEIKKTRQQEAEEARKVAEERQIAAYKSEISKFIDTNKDKYELVAAEGGDATELIYSTILEDYSAKLEANGEVAEDEIMSVEQASEIIEEQLLEEAKKRINLSKIKKLLEPAKAPVPKEEPKVGKKVSPTLSNDQAQEQGAKKQFLSDEESKREAAKLIRWTE